MPQKTRPDDSFLNFPVNAGMSPTHGEVLSFSTGTQQWTNTSGANLPFLDGRYLKLDASNDPLRGTLSIIPTGTQDGLEVQTKNNGIPFSFTQQGYAGATITAPIFSVVRQPADNSSPVFNRTMLDFQQSRASGTITGEFLTLLSDNVERISINPSAQGTGTLVKFDGDFTLSPNGLLLLLNNHSSPKFYVNASGTAYSNGEPLIKEAPTNSGTYGRKDAGWEEVTPKNGWLFVSESWIRVGNHTFIVSGNLTTRYRKGAKIQYNDGGVDYGVVGSSSFSSGTTTTINLITNTDYAMASNPAGRYISYVENPEGFPTLLNYTPTFSRTGVNYTNVPTLVLGTWNIMGNGQLKFSAVWQENATPGGTGNHQFTTPITTSSVGILVGSAYNASTNVMQMPQVASSTNLCVVTKYDGTTEVLASNFYVAGGIIDF